MSKRNGTIWIAAAILFVGLGGCAAKADVPGDDNTAGTEQEQMSHDQEANNRMALFSTQLSTGDSTVDIYTLNDEMLCEFKKKGYLAAIPGERFSEDVLASFPQEYLKEICMHGRRPIPTMIFSNSSICSAETAGIGMMRTQNRH